MTWGGFRGAGALRRILSKESLLFALNSGCLNSQAWDQSAAKDTSSFQQSTYTGAVRRLSALFIVVSHLVEVVFVELAHEAGEVAMLEVFGKDRLCESLILDTDSARGIEGVYPPARTSSTTKLPPSSPQRTT